MSHPLRFAAVSAFALALSLPSLSAQSIAPKGAVISGNANNNIPFSWYPTRYQQIYDYDAFTTGTTRAVFANQIAFRMSRLWLNMNGATVDVALWLGLTPTGIDSRSISSTFAKNIDLKTQTLVLSRSKVVLPKQKLFAFLAVFKFDKPTYTYLTTTKRSLVLEAHIFGNSLGNKSFTYPLDTASGKPGQGCARLFKSDASGGGGSYSQNQSFWGCRNSKGALPSQFANVADLRPGGTQAYLYGYSYLPLAPSILVIGALPIPSGGIPLPGTLCRLMQPIHLIFTGLCDKSRSGYTKYPLLVPKGKNFVGVKIYTQLFFLENGTSGFRLYATRGLQLTVGSGVPKAPGQFTTGTPSKLFGLVTEFRK